MNQTGSTASNRPSFVITIDTEGDNLWAKPRTIMTRNSDFLPRFQNLCEEFGLKPTYLTNFEMAECDRFRAFAKGVLKKNTAEIGMHLHAWNSPPLKPLTTDDMRYHPYLIEYPTDILEEKVSYMTALLESAFEIKPRSHRAGRWSFNGTYAGVLERQGYTVDCSVTPHVSYANQPGDPNGKGGTDFRRYPRQPYFLDLQDISRPGGSRLLEVPMTIISVYPTLDRIVSVFGYNGFVRRAFHRVFKGIRWLRPTGENLPLMLGILDRAEAEKWPYVEFMLHSSEFMPGGSPTFPTEASIERLYRDLKELFGAAARSFVGATLAEFGEYHRRLTKVPSPNQAMVS